MPAKLGETRRVETPITPEYDELVQSFALTLRAQNRSPRTIEGYLEALRALGEYLLSRNMPAVPADIRREHIQEFISDLLTRTSKTTGLPLKPSTAANRYRSLHVFFNWLVDEGELTISPMARMKAPHTVPLPPPIISESSLTALLNACAGRDFYARRDTAIIVLLLDTGMRRAEIAGLRVADVDLQNQTARVLGKGSKERTVAFGNQAALFLNRYLRARRIFIPHEYPQMWLTLQGPMRPNSIHQMIQRRAREAGIGRIWPHLFRHSFAHYFLDAGGQERDLKSIGGWQSDAMVRWYGSSAAQERAQRAHRQFSPGDRLVPHKNK